MFKYYFVAFKATLCDYMTMAELLAKEDVEKGFVVYDQQKQLACFGVQLHEDGDLNILPTQFTCVLGDTGIDNDDLDQPFQLEEGLFMSMLSCEARSGLRINEIDDKVKIAMAR